MSTWTPYNIATPLLTWSGTRARSTRSTSRMAGSSIPMAVAGGALLKSLAMEPPNQAWQPDPYTPPKEGELPSRGAIEIGAITQFVTMLVKEHDELPEPHTGLSHSAG